MMPFPQYFRYGSLLALLLQGAFLPSVSATGDGYAPTLGLDSGGLSAALPPEFFWTRELMRLAEPFAPKEKRVNGFLADYPEEVRHAKLETHSTLPDGQAPPEFGDYEIGRQAFIGKKWDDAQQAWEGLLKRPKEERRYRSVWAAYMLGKLFLRKQEPASSIPWFRKTRELAADGFQDAAGLAADSYGWEAQAELWQGHDGAAARLYLTQVALGDESAITSLKLLVPDREDAAERLSVPLPELPGNPAPSDADKLAERTKDRMARAVRDPILRSIETIHILATETYLNELESNEPVDHSRCLKWLQLVEGTKLPKVENAELLGWAAYTAGKYTEAQRWLKLADPARPLSLWLKAKLLRRQGNDEAATAAMLAVCKDIETHQPAKDKGSLDESSDTTISFADSDLGTLSRSRDVS